MAHQTPEFESKDVLGKTKHYNGATTIVAPVLVPTTSLGKISTVLVRNPASNQVNDKIYVAFDGNSTYLTLSRGEFVVWSPKNNESGTPITQIRIAVSRDGVNYETLFDFEP